MKKYVLTMMCIALGLTLQASERPDEGKKPEVPEQGATLTKVGSFIGAPGSDDREGHLRRPGPTDGDGEKYL